MLVEMVYCPSCSVWKEYGQILTFLGDGTGVCKDCLTLEVEGKEVERGYGFPLTSHIS